jgi:hypothetical protein
MPFRDLLINQTKIELGVCVCVCVCVCVLVVVSMILS